MRRVIVLMVAFVTALAFTVPAGAADPVDRGERDLPEHIEDQKLSTPRTATASAEELDGLFASADSARVIVRLKAPSVAEQKAKGKAAQQAKKNLESEQDGLLNRLLTADESAKVLAQVQLVLNAVFVEVSPDGLAAIVDDPAVLRVTPVADYELDLSETVPYIGAAAVQAGGYDGTGVRVAVLDSGIDYNHAALGGSGNPADYAANNPNIIEPGTFPTPKVVGGYDFVGSNWPTFGPEAPDPDPLDDGPQAGHGSHVGHIIGGVGGVAPGVDLYAVKVCSSVSTSCSGIALIQGMEFAVDPDGDADPSDHVDIVNMSLGAPYGQPFDDDLSVAVDNATAIGVLTVASAGNSADKPYITGTPSAAPTALSVAQTQVPSAGLQFLTVDGVDYPAVFQAWSAPLVATVGPVPVLYGGDFGQANGCSTDASGESELPADRPFAPGTFSGEIVLVDRGACTFTAKIRNVEYGGGSIGIIGLVAPGAPFSGGFGGGTAPTIPGYMINQADSGAIKAQIGGPGIGTVDPSNQLPLIGQMVGGSSRGPSNFYQAIKPEIGAPGASVSAIAGTGTGEGPFGGTSGAAPMVSGSAALLLQAESALDPLEAKARLMNTGETDIDTDPFAGPAPITRIGGGEVRVDQAVAAQGGAWDDDGAAGALSFGFVDVSKNTVTLHKTVRVRNYSDSNITYSIDPSFRYASDEASGAVSISAPSKVKVRAGKDATFQVKLTIDGEALSGNYMNSGSQGANGAALTLNEFDGYLTLDDGVQPIHLAWHVLPRKASNVVGRQVLNFDGGIDVVDLTNNGVGTAQNDAYALIATSPDTPRGDLGEQAPMPDIRAAGVNTFPVPAGFCSGEPSFVWAFAVNTWERQSHVLPVSNQILLDTDQDGVSDYAVLNRDVSFSGLSDGRQLTWALNLSTGGASAFFFAEHSTNTGNTVMLICGEQVGLTGTDMLATNVDVTVVAQDWYFGGGNDVIEGLTITPLGEQYLGLPSDIAGKSTDSMTVIDFGPFPGNSSEEGLLLITNGDRGTGARGGATQDTEAILFSAP